ncbi:MAG: Ig-like domain-containing protein [Oscillospiraceae bacterium]|nr:Ig-like domain-containing protein [Oscillospiraceae bacterium]
MPEKERESKALKQLEESNAVRVWLMRGVVGFLGLIFLGGIAWGANDLLSRESPQPPAEPLHESILDPPKTSTEILSYLNEAIRFAKEERPKYNAETVFTFPGIEEDSPAEGEGLTVTGSHAEKIKTAFRLAAPELEEYLSGTVQKQETEYGGDFVPYLLPVNAGATDFSELRCEFIYYRCEACGKEEGEPQEVCPDCRAENAYKIAYRDNYTITLVFAPDNAASKAMFPPRSAEEVAALLGDEVYDRFQARGITTSTDQITVVATVNRESKKLLALHYQKKLHVGLGLAGKAALEPLGAFDLEFNLLEEIKNDFTWPAVHISERERTMGRNESAMLSVRLDAPEGAEVVWKSSDEKIVTVDQQGYIKTGKEFGEAQVSATILVNGREYTDACAISVRIPAEKIKLSHRKLSLAPEERAQLEAVISPAKATNQTVTWHTEDPAIATVDKKGLVTAHSPGTVTVYALAQDGYYRASCVITVKGAEAWHEKNRLSLSSGWSARRKIPPRS